MTEQEKLILVLAHTLAHQETQIQYLKALLMEQMKINIEDFQDEEEAFWEKSKHYRIYETLKNFQGLQEQINAIPEHMDLDMYRDHLRWPSDPPSEDSHQDP